MSFAKRKLEKVDEMNKIAQEILFEIGVIKSCNCGKVFYETYKFDKKEIYAIATNKLKEKIGNQFEYKTFHKQIDEILKVALSGNDCECCSNK